MVPPKNRDSNIAIGKLAVSVFYIRRLQLYLWHSFPVTFWLGRNLHKILDLTWGKSMGKHLLIFVILFFNMLYSQNYPVEQTVSENDIKSDLCFLQKQVFQQIKYIKKKNMIDILPVEGEEFYAPGIFYISLYLKSDNPKAYAAEIWMMALGALAYKFAERDLIKRKKTNDWLKVVKEISSILKAHGNYLDIFSSVLEAGYNKKDVVKLGGGNKELKKIVKPIARLIRNYYYESEYARIDYSIKRFSNTVSGILMVLSGIEGLAKLGDLNEKVSEILLEGSLANIYLYKIANIIRTNYLFDNNSSLKQAIDNFENTPYIFNHEMIKNIMLNSVLLLAGAKIVASGASVGATIGSVLPGPGTLIGAISGAIISLVAFELISQSNEFSLYFDISTALLTLSVRFQEKNIRNGDAIYLANIAYITAVKILKENVIGKGLTSAVGRMLGGMEKKWDGYISSSFNLYEIAVEKPLYNLESLMLNNKIEFSYSVNCPKKASYYVFVIDVSESMNDNGKLEQVKKVVPQLIANFPPKNNYYALIVYSERFGCNSGKIILSFTMNKSKLVNAVNNLTAAGGTPMEAGLLTAFKMASSIPEGEKGHIYLLCDGQQNCPKPERNPALKNIIIKKYGIYGKLKITAKTLQSLSQNTNVPPELIDKLSNLKGKVFNSVSEYDSTLQAVLGEKVFQQFKQNIDLYIGATGLPATVSTISLGQGVDNATLQRLANQGSGYFFKAEDPAQLKNKMRQMMLKTIPSQEKVKSLLPYLSIVLIFLLI